MVALFNLIGSNIPLCSHKAVLLPVCRHPKAAFVYSACQLFSLLSSGSLPLGFFISLLYDERRRKKGGGFLSRWDLRIFSHILFM